MSINRSWAAFGVQLLEIYCTKDCEKPEQELEEEGLGICIFKTPAVSPSQSESVRVYIHSAQRYRPRLMPGD